MDRLEQDRLMTQWYNRKMERMYRGLEPETLSLLDAREREELAK